MNADALLPTLFSTRAPVRALIIGVDTPMQQAVHLVDSLVMGRYYPMIVEDDGAIIAQGFIELTPTGYHVHLRRRSGEVVIALSAGTGADTCWALGTFLQAYSE